MEITHTATPWEVHEINDGHIGDNEVISRGFRSSVTGKGINTGEDYEMFSAADAERIVQCVNACAGLSDPEATITALVEALQELIEVVDGVRGLPDESEKCDELCGNSWCQSLGCIPMKMQQARAALQLAGQRAGK